ncbi:MAG: NUDIX hydrolase, partial [Janthinobacterium lividum]
SAMPDFPKYSGYYTNLPMPPNGYQPASHPGSSHASSSPKSFSHGHAKSDYFGPGHGSSSAGSPGAHSSATSASEGEKFKPAPTFSTLALSSTLMYTLKNTHRATNFRSRDRTAQLLLMNLGVTHPTAFFKTSEELNLVERQEKVLHSDLGRHFHDLLLLYTTGKSESKHLQELRTSIPRYSVELCFPNEWKMLYRGLALRRTFVDRIMECPMGPKGRRIAHQLVHGFRHNDGGYSGKGVASTSTWEPTAKYFSHLCSAYDRREVLLHIKIYGRNTSANQTGARGVTIRYSQLPGKSVRGENEIILDLTNRYEISKKYHDSKGRLVVEMVAYGIFSGNESGKLKNTDAWKQESQALGSNPGGIFRDQNGMRWYVKMASEERLKNEYLANRFYGALGLTVPQTELVLRNGKMALASQMMNVKNLKPGDPVHGLRRGFIFDAWLANWDVVGSEYDNMKVLSDHGVVRLDSGGALLYRAMGEPKGAAFGKEVNEIYTFLNGSNAQSKAVFHAVDKDNLRRGIKELQHYKDADIRKKCMEWGPGSRETREKLASTLIARKNWLVAQLADGLPRFHEKTRDDGRMVILDNPSTPTAHATWLQEMAVAVAVPNVRRHLPSELNGQKIHPWHAPRSIEEWSKLEPQLDFGEGSMKLTAGLVAASGVLIIEPDGRLWLVEPSNHAYGVNHTFPKGNLEKGLKLKANAIKETFEETGLKVELTGFLGDYDRTTTKARYYIGRRIGGTPADMGWESQSVKLVPLHEAERLCNLAVDATVLRDLRHYLEHNVMDVEAAKARYVQKLHEAAQPASAHKSTQNAGMEADLKAKAKAKAYADAEAAAQAKEEVYAKAYADYLKAKAKAKAEEDAAYAVYTKQKEEAAKQKEEEAKKKAKQAHSEPSSAKKSASSTAEKLKPIFYFAGAKPSSASSVPLYTKKPGIIPKTKPKPGG